MSNAAACIVIFLALDDEEGKEIVKNVLMKEGLKKRNKLTHEKLVQELLLSARAKNIFF